MDKNRQTKAADALEDLEPVLKEMVRLLRQGQSDGKAYALVYELRKRMGYVVNGMGRSGLPSAEDVRYANDVFESQLWAQK